MSETAAPWSGRLPGAMELRIFTEPQQGASYDDQLAIAMVAEELGFDAFFRSDHIMAFSGDGLPGPTDAWTTLAGLARDTSRIRLGTLVSPVTFRHPGMLAIQVAQVDQMSNGRVELGLGAGWNDREHAAYGVPYPATFGQRFAHLDEQLQILTGLWSTPVGERFTFEGEHYTLTDSPGLPKPVQSPLPIVIGGGGPKKTPALAARFASDFNRPFVPPDVAKAGFDLVRAACEAVDRDPATLVLSAGGTVCCGHDEEELERRAARLNQPLENLRKNGIAGTPEEIVQRLHAFAAAGASRVYLQVLDMSDLDHVRLLGEEVLPQVS